MSKTILLHIGTPKTGTTSIQEALSCAFPQSSAVCYPLGGRDRSQLRLATLYLSHDQLPVHLAQFYPVDDKHFQRMRRRYRDLVFGRLASANRAILSAEILSNLFTPSAAGQLRDDLKRIGYRTFHVVLYVRDPADYFLSVTQQILKSSSSTSPDGYHPASFRYEFRRMVETWEQVFPGRVVVRKFPPSSTSDVVQDFSSLLQQFLDVSLPEHPVRANTTISAESMQILQDYRGTFWPKNRGILTPDSSRLVDFLTRSTAEIHQTKPVLNREVAEQIRANHKEDAAFLNANYGVDLGLTNADPNSRLGINETYRINDLLEFVDPNVVHQLLLHLARTELHRSPSSKSLPRRTASRVKRQLIRSAPYWNS